MVSILFSGTTFGLAYAADDDDLFEIGRDEGIVNGTNIIDDQPDNSTVGAYPDWGALFNSTGQIEFSAGDPNEPDFSEIFGGVFAVFIADDLALKGATDDTIFASSNKNDDLVNTWQWDTGNVPAKTDLANVYAYAAIRDSDKHLIVYLGLERLAPNGDSHIDIEFNQQAIGLDRSVPCGDDETAPPVVDPQTDDGSPCEFTGNKTAGDLVVTMDFTRGGTLGSIEIRTWDGTQFNLDATIAEGCNTLAATGFADDSICGFNNGVDIDRGSWPTFEAKRGLLVGDEQLLANAFTEIGIDITEILGETPCFGTIQAKTRSSQSFSAELKDFALANFDLCKVEVEKTGPEQSKIGDDVTYHFNVTNTGVTTLFMLNITDNVIGDLTGNGAAASCGSLNASDSCAFDVNYTVMGGDPDPLNNTVTVNYNPVANFTGVNLSDSDDHSLNLFQPNVTLSKTGDEISKVGDTINYIINVTNTSSDGTPDMDCNLTDPLTSLDVNFTLASGAWNVTNTQYVVQGNDTDPLLNTASVSCSPDGFPNIINGTDGHSVDLFVPSVQIIKGGPTMIDVGETMTYTFLINNTSGQGTPDLIFDSITDTILNDTALTAAVPGDCDVLATGETCNFTFDVIYDVLPEPNPVNNTVTVHYHPEGFPNDIMDSDDHSVEVKPVGAPLLVQKFYDANANGVKDGGEAFIEGWLIDIVFEPDGAASSFTNFTKFNQTVDTGLYLVLEATPLNDLWVPTNNEIPADPPHFITDVTIAASSSTRVNVDSSGGEVLFGNLCLGPDNARTIGFWGNRNGAALFLSDGENNLKLLNDLPLANDNGAIVNFTDYSDFKSWLKDARAVNMAYMLSAQLAAMELNVANGLVNGDDLVFSVDFGIISINDLMQDAIDALNANDFTPDGVEPDRTIQTEIKDALDDANNNINYVQPTAESCLPLVFPDVNGTESTILTSTTTEPSGDLAVFTSVSVNSDSSQSNSPQTSDDLTDDKKGGGGDEHLTRPTFGVSHETYETLVDSGFKFNDQSFAINDNHHTLFAEQTVNIGEVNSFEAKLYADKGLRVQEFLFGIPNIGEAHLAELGIEVWYGYNGEIEDVKAVQKSNVIDKETIVATHEKTKCQALDIEAKCDTTKISMVFLEPLKDKVMAIKAIDYKNRYQITYLNAGFDISGESLNPMAFNMIPSSVRDEGLLKVTQAAKYSPYWVAEDGRMFEMNSFGSFKQINQSFDRFDDTGIALTRMHSGFGGIIAYEQERATSIFDASKLISELPDYFAYHFPEATERMSTEMKQKMYAEEQRAIQYLKELENQHRQ